MLTILEILIVLTIIPVVIWALLPVKRIPRIIDFLPLVSALLLILHLFVDYEPMRLRLIPIYIISITIFIIKAPRMFRHNPYLPKKRRVLSGVLRIISLMAIAAAVAVPTLILPFYPTPEPTGEYNTGTVTCDLTDLSRPELFTREDGDFRELAVQFWYPTDAESGVKDIDIENATLSADQQTYPVLIFSHGAYGIRKSNESTFRELASHGYIVASIDHTYHAFYTAFPDGRTVMASQTFLNEVNMLENETLSAGQVFEITNRWLKLRTDDINFVLDSMETGDLGEAGGLLDGRMNFSKIGLFGHSLGGAAAAQVCRERGDIKSVIVIDGTMIGDVTKINGDYTEEVTRESFPEPIMLMYNESYNDPEAKASAYLPNINAFDNASGPAYALYIKGAGHLNFTDLPSISPVLAGMMGTGSIDSYNCMKTVNDYTLAFFDKHLKGLSPALLEDGVNDGKLLFQIH